MKLAFCNNNRFACPTGQPGVSNEPSPGHPRLANNDAAGFLRHCNTIIFPALMGVLAAFLGVLASPPVARAQSGDDTTRIIDKFIGGMGADVQVTYDGVAAGARAGVTTIDTMTLGRGGQTILVARDVTIDNLQAFAGNGIMADKAAAGSIRMFKPDGGESSLSTGVEFSKVQYDPRIVAEVLLDETFVVTNLVFGTLARMTVDRLHVDGFEMPFYFDWGEKRFLDGVFRFEDVNLVNLRDRRIGQFDVGDMVLEGSTEVIPEELGYDRIHSRGTGSRTTNIDLRALEQVLSPGTYGNRNGTPDSQSREWFRYYESSEFASMSIKGGPISYETGKGVAGASYLRPFSDNRTLGVLVDLLSSRGSFHSSGEPDPKDVAALFAVASSARQDFQELASINTSVKPQKLVDDSDFESSTVETSGFDLSIDKMRIDDYRGFSWGAFTMENVQLNTDKKPVFSYELLRMDDSKLTDIDALITLMNTMPDMPQEEQKATIGASIPRILPSFSLISLRKGVVHNPLDDEAEPIRYDAAKITMGGHIRQIPTQMGIAIDNLNIPASVITTPEVQQALQDLGYNAITGDLNIDLAWDEKTQTVALKDTYIRAREVGEISLGTEIGSIPRALFEDPVNNTMSAMFASLISAQVRFDNHSIYERLLDAQAKNIGAPPEQLTAMVPFFVQHYLAELASPELAQEASDAIAAFVADPKNIRVSIKPDVPIPFVQLLMAGQQSRTDAIEILQPEIDVNE